MLSRDPEGVLCLEDGDGRVRLDMTDAVSRSVDVQRELTSGAGRRPIYRRMHGADRGGIYNRGNHTSASHGSSPK
jgi:hypothetical protein